MEGGDRRHRVEGVGPHVGADGGVVVKHDEGGRRNGVTGLHPIFGKDVETDIPLSMFEGVVDGQETHLGTGGFGARGRVDALENPEQLVVHNVDAGVHIHPDP